MVDYIRVLPRDLFNEASLLKMLGKLWILLDDTRGHQARFEEEDVVSFDIAQDQASGSIRATGLSFTIRGEAYLLTRPLNSRAPWPLWIDRPDDPNFDSIAVFNDDGKLSEDMRQLIGLS
jgi:hypothetical protein